MAPMIIYFFKYSLLKKNGQSDANQVEHTLTICKSALLKKYACVLVHTIEHYGLSKV